MSDERITELLQDLTEQAAEGMTFAELEAADLPAEKKSAIQRARIIRIRDRYLRRLSTAEPVPMAQVRADVAYMIELNARANRVALEANRQCFAAASAVGKARGERDAALLQLKNTRAELDELRRKHEGAKVEIATEADLRALKGGTKR